MNKPWLLLALLLAVFTLGCSQEQKIEPTEIKRTKPTEIKIESIVTVYHANDHDDCTHLKKLQYRDSDNCLIWPKGCTCE